MMCKRVFYFCLFINLFCISNLIVAQNINKFCGLNDSLKKQFLQFTLDSVTFYGGAFSDQVEKEKCYVATIDESLIKSYITKSQDEFIILTYKEIERRNVKFYLEITSFDVYDDTVKIELLNRVKNIYMSSTFTCFDKKWNYQSFKIIQP
jgi:hypothetical protein